MSVRVLKINHCTNNDVIITGVCVSWTDMTSVRPLSKPRSRNKLTDTYADVVLLVCVCVCLGQM